MAFQLSQGLFSPDFTDFHAVIGVPVDASNDEIRKRYLKVAKRLHPDSFAAASPEDRQTASELLSKLVNPAYKKLNAKDKDFAEYQLLLKLKAQEAMRSGPPILRSAKAKELQTALDWAEAYRTSLMELTKQQYASLSQTLNLIGELSELNLVYLMRREAQGKTPNNTSGRPQRTSPQAKQPKVENSTSVAAKTTSPGVSTTTQPGAPLSLFIDAYCRRAEELLAKNQFSGAIKELRDALKDDPTNSRCHALLGKVYLQQNQLTMARISFDQALKYDPKNAQAIDGKQEIEKLSKINPKNSGARKNNKEKTGGGLFGLFGGGRK